MLKFTVGDRFCEHRFNEKIILVNLFQKKNLF